MNNYENSVPIPQGFSEPVNEMKKMKVSIEVHFSAVCANGRICKTNKAIIKYTF
jgi:hypothetical protein